MTTIMANEDRTAALRRIKDQVLELTSSPLYAYRQSEKNFPVIGEGSHSAAIMFVGEAPGKNEAKTGRPFVGAAGKILDELLASIGLPRPEVYITNIVKDRPPANRDPLPEEIECYGPFLDQQIEIIQPKVIATLGRFSMSYIMTRLGLESDLQPISVSHGKLFTAKTSYGSVKILPLYHPAVAIYDRSKLDTLKADFKKVKELI